MPKFGSKAGTPPAGTLGFETAAGASGNWGSGLIRNSQKVKASVSNTHCNHADTDFNANPDPYPAVYLIRI